MNNILDEQNRERRRREKTACKRSSPQIKKKRI